MSPALSCLVLLAAAVLEAGGDALIRSGLHRADLAGRIGLLSAGAAVLLAYGLSVNAPPWDFGRLLGVYVALFFLVAQAVNLLAFGIRPDAATLIGGALVVAGGLVMAAGPR